MAGLAAAIRKGGGNRRRQSCCCWKAHRAEGRPSLCSACNSIGNRKRIHCTPQPRQAGMAPPPDKFPSMNGENRPRVTDEPLEV